MNVAIPHWQGRVSPVFDVAGNVLVVTVDNGSERLRRDLAFGSEGVKDEDQNLRLRAGRLKEAGADVLICGAISRPLELTISATGVEVVSQICGDVERVLVAFIDGQLDQGAFFMPGCCGRLGQFGQRRGRGNGQCWQNRQKGGDGYATR